MKSYQQDIEAAVETKLLELDGLAYGISTGRRFQMAGKNSDGSIMTLAQHRENHRLVMTDIANRVGLHFFQMTDAVMLDQLIAVSVIQNHDTAGLLKSLMNSFMIAYTCKETSSLAYQQLQGLELLRARVDRGVAPTRH